MAAAAASSEIHSEPATGEPQVQTFIKACSTQGFADVDYRRYGPDRVLLTTEYSKWADYIRNMEVRPDDTWVITFPRCGTTWAQEMVWLLCNNLDYAKAKELRLPQRFPFLEINTIQEPSQRPTTMERVAEMPSPRFIKSHLPPSLLPKQLMTVKPKIVAVVRDPKDATVSHFHQTVLFEAYKGTLDDFVRATIADAVIYCPFWAITKSLCSMRSEPNVLFLTFEEMKADLSSVVRRACEFFNVHLTPEQVSELVVHLSFDSMRTNKSVNYEAAIEWSRSLGNEIPENGAFIRKGQVGTWKTEISEESVRLMDEWTKTNGITGLYGA